MTRPVFYRSLRRRVTLAAICTLPMLWVIAATIGRHTRSAPADLLITNGRVYAADGTGRFYQAVAVGGGTVLRPAAELNVCCAEHGRRRYITERIFEYRRVSADRPARGGL